MIKPTIVEIADSIGMLLTSGNFHGIYSGNTVNILHDIGDGYTVNTIFKTKKSIEGSVRCLVKVGKDTKGIVIY